MSGANSLAQPWSSYNQIIIETYQHGGKIRARPVTGQLYPVSMNVECSRDMRKRHPVGTRFRIYAKETDREDGTPFLYTHYSWPYDVL